MPAKRCRSYLAGCGLALLASATAIEADAAGISFEDQRGKQIELAEPATRVVALPKPVPTLILAVDEGSEHLIGMHPAAQAVIMDSILGKFFPDVAKINTHVVAEGFIPNVEELLRINPDLVIQWALRIEDYIEPMERVGLKVAGFSYGTHEIEAERIALVGAIFGKQDRAASFLEWQNDVLDMLDKKLAAIPPDDRKRMAFFDIARPDKLAVFGRDEFFFRVPGLRNVAFEAGLNQSTVTVDAEQVLAWDPDIIFINYYDPQAVPADLYNNPVFAGLSAVTNRRVYKTPSLGPELHEAPLVWMWMAMLAYPDLFDMDLRRTVKEKFAAMYGASLSDDDVDHIMNMAANGESGHYRDMFGR